MRNINKKLFLLALFFGSGMLSLRAQSEIKETQTETKVPEQHQTAPSQEHLEPVVITIGKKNEMFVGKNALANARKLSAFYFEKNGMDPADYKINRYYVTITPKGGNGPGLQMDCYTDFFHEKIIDALRAAPAGSKISFTNIKASSKNPKDNSIGLMPDMQLTLKEDAGH